MAKVDPVDKPNLIDRITVNGTVYFIEDGDVPAWARASTKPTYNGGEVKYTGTTGNVITNNTTVDVALRALDTAVNTRLKFQLCADEAAYNAITNKDSSTLYLIPES